ERSGVGRGIQLGLRFHRARVIDPHASREHHGKQGESKNHQHVAALIRPEPLCNLANVSHWLDPETGLASQVRLTRADTRGLMKMLSERFSVPTEYPTTAGLCV